MIFNPDQPSNRIKTDDLNYVSQGGKYSYSFSYLGNGAFFLKSKGFLDEKSFKHQFVSGDIARERLKEDFPDLKYHLVWDMSEISGVYLFARHQIVPKMKRANNFGSISIIGATIFAQNYIKLISTSISHIKFFFYRTFEEASINLENTFKELSKELPVSENIFFAPETEAYGRFLEIWQTQKGTMEIGKHCLKYIEKPEWIYSSDDGLFKVTVIVLEGNIVYYRCEGFAKPFHIENTYAILDSIIQELRLNTQDNKFYSVVEVNKIKGVSLLARRRVAELVMQHRAYVYMVFLIPSTLVQFIFKIVKKIGGDNFSHWEISPSIEDTVNKIVLHQRGKFYIKGYDENVFKKEPLVIPKSKSDMIRLIQQQHEELQHIKRYQKEQIQKILSFTGSMTWDESFEPPNIISEEKHPFSSVFNSLSILFTDFKEIIQDTSLKARQLQESEDKYRNLINLASDVIFVYQDSKLKFVNSRVIQALGYSIEEIIGQSMDRFVIPDQAQKLQEYYDKRVKGDNVPWIYESIFLHKDGHPVPVSMSVGLITFEGKPASMVIARDITQKKKTEEELERYRNHLEDIVRKRTEQLQKEVTDRRIAEESDRLKTAFLSNMSHEIRTPMNAIIAFSNFLKENGLTQDQREEYLNYIQSSGQSLLNLINDIIDISKIEARQLNVQIGPCKVASLLEELYQIYEQARKNSGKTNVRLELRIPDNANVVVNSDPYRLKQIISNLIDNSLKFTDTGYIEFGFTIEENDIILYVKDTGIGIPPEKQELIFKRFGRLHSNDRNISGTGLGLAISKNLASLLNGKLWVESKENAGSAFYLKIPNFTPAIEQEAPKISATEQKNNYIWTNKTILIAEDEDLNYKVLQIALVRTGAAIIRAHNGKEAVNMVSENKSIDIVLMDIQMPEMDGYEAMSLIKKAFPQKPIIAQTAFALLEERKKCIDLGFNDYVAKPIQIKELLSKIDVFLRDGQVD
jgi:PAS domain S-box-containing protein